MIAAQGRPQLEAILAISALFLGLYNVLRR